MSKVIYCISGLGTDEKIFVNLTLEGYRLEHIKWLRPNKKESIETYAARMATFIQGPDPIIIGVSFGGMVAIEIAKQITVKKLFIISAVRSATELPRWMKLVATFKLNRILPIRSFKFTEKFDNDKLGVSNEEERLLAAHYRKHSDPVYMKWAVNEALNWKNDRHPDDIVHIHGDKDKMFPIKTISADHIIKEGTHMMIYNRAKDIAVCIEKELSRAL